MAEYGIGPSGHPYHRFGTGDDRLVVLPGITDALAWNSPDRLSALSLSAYYFRQLREYDIWFLSRPPGRTRDSVAAIAADYEPALAAIGPANVLGIGLGGSVGAHLAAHRPDLVDRFVLLSAGTGPGPAGRATLQRWRTLTRQRRYREFNAAYARTVYTGWRRHLFPPLYRVLEPRFLTPESHDCLPAACRACLTVEESVLDRVDVPALVVGGRQDRLVPVTHHREAARRLDAPLALGRAGHALYEEQRSAVAGTIESFIEGTLPPEK